MRNTNNACNIRVVHCGHKQCHNTNALKPGTASEIVNLREREQSLEVMGKPMEVMTLNPADRILLADDADYVLLRGSSLMVGDEVLATAMPADTRVHRVGALLVADTPEQTLYFRRHAGGAYVRLNLDEAVPQIHLSELESRTLSGEVPAYDFKNAYAHWQAPLADDDVQAFGTLVGHAWNRLRGEADENGLLTGMTLARYGVRLHDDSYLWLSAPVLLGEDTLTNPRTVADVIVGSNTFTGVGRSVMNVVAYRLGIHVLSGVGSAWEGLVKSVDILVSPEAATRYASTVLDYRCATVGTGTGRTYELQYALPSRNRSAILADVLGGKWMVAASATNVAALASHAFDATNVTRSVQTLFEGVGGYVVQSPRLDAIVVSLATAAQLTTHLGESHHGACSMVSNDTLYRGGGTVSRRYRWSAMPLFRGMMSRETTEVATQITVNTAQGVKTWLCRETLDYCPDRLSGFVAVHDVNASHIVISVTTGGVARYWEGDLTPLHRHGMAVCITDTLAARDFIAGTLAVAPDAEEVLTADAHGHISTTMPGNALAQGEAAKVFGGSVLWLAMAGQPLYNGGFGRYPIYVFTTQGIFAMPQNASGTYGEARLVNHRVASADVAPVAGDDCVWFLTDYGSICSLRATKVVDHIGEMSPLALAWSSAKQELLALQPNRLALVLMPSGNYTFWHINADSFYADAVTALAVDAEGKVCDLNVEESAVMPVKYISQPIELDGLFRKRITAVTWDLCGADIDVTAEVNGEKGINNLQADLLQRARITGTVDAPLRMPAYCPPVKRFRLLLGGTMTTGSLIRPTNVDGIKLNTPYFCI